MDHMHVLDSEAPEEWVRVNTVGWAQAGCAEWADVLQFGQLHQPCQLKQQSLFFGMHSQLPEPCKLTERLDNIIWRKVVGLPTPLGVKM
jgi:hypothetical protein